MTLTFNVTRWVEHINSERFNLITLDSGPQEWLPSLSGHEAELGSILKLWDTFAFKKLRFYQNNSFERYLKTANLKLRAKFENIADLYSYIYNEVRPLNDCWWASFVSRCTHDLFYFAACLDQYYIYNVPNEGDETTTVIRWPDEVLPYHVHKTRALKTPYQTFMKRLKRLQLKSARLEHDIGKWGWLLYQKLPKYRLGPPIAAQEYGMMGRQEIKEYEAHLHENQLKFEWHERELCLLEVIKIYRYIEPLQPSVRPPNLNEARLPYNSLFPPTLYDLINTLKMTLKANDAVMFNEAGLSQTAVLSEAEICYCNGNSEISCPCQGAVGGLE